MSRFITNHEQNMRIVDEVMLTGKSLGIGLLVMEDERMNGRTIKIDGRDIVNFGSGNYLGLELDPRLKAAAIDAVDRYGTVVSATRVYTSIGLYPTLETLLGKVFNAHALVSVNTSIAHITNVPVLVGDNDAVILDIQVHACVHNAIELLRVRNIPIEKIRHNRMDILEERIIELKEKHDKIWYFADGVYSMFGDYAPVKEVEALLEKYEQFHVYFDDSHGLSWTGEHGSGYVRSQMPVLHRRAVVVYSMFKGFGSTGGISVFPTEVMKQRVRACGYTYIFSGPLCNPILGASIASAKIHLSPEIGELQAKLLERILLFKDLAAQYELPLVHPNDSPIFFIGVGKPKVGYNLAKRLMNRGYYVNLAAFPSVSYNRTGIRLLLTTHQTLDDVKNLAEAIATDLKTALVEEEYSMKSIFQAFKMTAGV